MRIVVALGGNALIRQDEPASIETQRKNAKVAARDIAGLIGAGHDVVLTHGDGPQIGLMALQDDAYDPVLASPLDVLTAEAQGMVGYVLLQELENSAGLGGLVAALLTRIEVDPADPAFDQPSKPIGPVYETGEADELASRHGWKMVPDKGGVRRAVPSPRPLRILELAIVKQLLSSGVTVICAGGGGIAVVKESGGWRGVEAVIDKDFASALLARDVDADVLLLLTDVDGVYAGWGSENQRLISVATPEELKQHEFAAGSMRPKVLAAVEFVEHGGTFAGIGGLEDALAIVEGGAGTRIRR
jgi:carbamate kinase